MPGPPPKPSHLRQRTNRKAGATVLKAPTGAVDVPTLPNPDGREWHPMTVSVWAEWWQSEMASAWLQTDIAGLGLLAMLYDDYFQRPNLNTLKEIRLQRQCFGLTPVDRSRLQWEIGRSEESERRRTMPERNRRTGTHDPRSVLMAIK